MLTLDIKKVLTEIVKKKYVVKQNTGSLLKIKIRQENGENTIVIYLIF